MHFIPYLLALSGISSVLALDIREETHSLFSNFTTHIRIDGTTQLSPKLYNYLELFANYNAAAYCRPQQQGPGAKIDCGKHKSCALVTPLNTKIYKKFLGVGGTGATGFVAADHTNKMIVTTLRGSVNLKNWAADMKFMQVDCNFIVAGARCDKGFLKFWRDSKPLVMEGIAAAKKDNPDYPLVITGHSLGGAAAVYAAAELRKQGNQVALFTYGQPRAGNRALSEFVSRQQGGNYRVTHTSDEVPKLPPIKGSIAYKYTHITPEYWISSGNGNPSVMKVLEGFDNPGGNTGTGQHKFNIFAHIGYFQNNMYHCVLPIKVI